MHCRARHHLCGLWRGAVFLFAAFAAIAAPDGEWRLPALGVDIPSPAVLAGTCSENLQAVTFSVTANIDSGSHALTAPCIGGIWRLERQAFPLGDDEALRFEMTHGDRTENHAALSAMWPAGSGSARLGVDAPAVIHAGNQREYTLAGSCSEAGGFISLTLLDSGGHPLALPETAQPPCLGQRWGVVLPDLSALNDGLVQIVLTHRGKAADAASLRLSAMKTTVWPAVSIDPWLFVNAGNQSAFPLSGTCSEAKQTVLLRVNDSNQVSVYGAALCSGTHWSLPGLDLSRLGGGELHFFATHGQDATLLRTARQSGFKETAAGISTPLTAGVAEPVANPGAAPARQQWLARQTQAISFPRLPNKRLGDAPWVVSATASSALPVSFSSLTPLVCSSSGHQGSTIHLLLAGNCTVQARQEGNDQFAAAVAVEQSFTVAIPAQGDATGGQPALAAGGSHSLVIKADGSVWAWGANERGQLGDGGAGGGVSRSTPVWVGDLGANGIGAGNAHSHALSGGVIRSWGANDYGQLGDGTTTDRSTPVLLAGALPASTNFTAIAVGGDHTLALAGGEVWAWGANGDGQTGQATGTAYNATPARIAGLTGVTAVAAGAHHALALKSDGTVWAWGRNAQGQLGNGTVAGSSTPVQVADLTGVTAIAAGGEHSLALKGDGSVWAWGGDWAGQLGNGASVTANQNKPVAVSGFAAGETIAAVKAGQAWSLALTTSGKVYVWGDNAAGQMGSQYVQKRQAPVLFSGLDDGSVLALAAGENHALALKRDGSIAVWGDNSRGQLGDGSWPFRPEAVNAGVGAALFAAGAQHVLASGINKSASHAWGSNWKRQINDSEEAMYRANANEVTSSTFTASSAVAAGHAHSVNTSDAISTGYGDNSSGQKGEALANGYTQLAAGAWHSLAIDANQKLWAWGSNDAGQLGSVGGSVSIPRAVDTSAMSGAISRVAAGAAHSVALDGDGRLWLWGSNLFGQLGDGAAGNSSAPRLLSGAFPATGSGRKIAAGRYHNVALIDGKVWTWGRNSAGQLGSGTRSDSATPRQVLGDAATVITKIAAGAQHTLALDSAGGVWVWGSNRYGQLGNATTIDVLAPTKIATTGVEIAAGADYSLVLPGEGKNLLVFGDGRDGQLGFSETAAAIRPGLSVALINPASASSPALTLLPLSGALVQPGSFSGTSSLPGTIYWVFLRSKIEKAPNPDQIKSGVDGTDSADFTAGAGNKAVDKGVFSITPPTLLAGAAYRLFVCLVKTGEGVCAGNAASVDFSTAASGSDGASYALNVSVAGTNGAGFVVSDTESRDGTALYCATGVCTKNYLAGQRVTVQAVSNSAATFAGWSGTGCSGVLPTCTVSAAANVTATFNRTDTGGVAQFSSGAYSVREGGVTTITLARSGDIGQAAAVNVGVSGGTALPAHYTLSATSVGFAAGQAMATLTIAANAGSNGKTVQLSLSPGSGSPTIGVTGSVTVSFRKPGGVPWQLLLLD